MEAHEAEHVLASELSRQLKFVVCSIEKELAYFEQEKFFLSEERVLVKCCTRPTLPYVRFPRAAYAFQ